VRSGGSKNTRRICRTITPINWNWQRHWFWLASYEVGCYILIRNKRVTEDRCALRNAVSSSQPSLNLELFAFRILITLR